MFHDIAPLVLRGDGNWAALHEPSGAAMIRGKGGWEPWSFDEACALRDWLIAATKPGYAKDAERYRWLRIRHENFSRTYTHFRNDAEAEELDAAIDAALAASQAKGQIP